MKTVKKLTAVVMMIALAFSLAACNGNKEEVTTTQEYTYPEVTSAPAYVSKFAALYAPFGIPATLLDQDRSYAYDVSYFGSIPDVCQAIKSGNAEIATLPLKNAVELYNETNGKIRIVCVSTTGFLYVVQKGDSVKELNDLNGKRIAASNEGTVNDEIMNRVFETAGIKPKVEYYETFEDVIASDADIMMLPEPYVSKLLFSNKEYSVAVDFAAEWEKQVGVKLSQACVVVTQDYIDNHPEELYNFMVHYEIAVNFMTNVETYKHAVSAPLIKAAFFNNYDLALTTVPRCGVAFIYGDEMKTVVSKNIEQLIEFIPDLAGVTPPGDDIFYNVL